MPGTSRSESSYEPADPASFLKAATSSLITARSLGVGAGEEPPAGAAPLAACRAGCLGLGSAISGAGAAVVTITASSVPTFALDQ
jgi:hypothetical protein